MKLFFATLLIMAVFQTSFGQNTDFYDFAGLLTTSDGQVMSFKLTVNEIKDGKFKGYSETDYEGDDYTKSIIEGEFNLKEKKMSFREISNTETTSNAEVSTFCYITASNLTIDYSGKKNIIKGKFQGVFPSGKVCATGVVFLVNEDALENIVKENKPAHNDSESKKPEAKVHTDSVFTSNDVLLITEWRNDLTIEVWDGDLQDNDEISIYLNDVLKKEKVTLRHTKTTIALPTKENNFRLKIVALNEGRSGKNTLHFRLKNADTDKVYVSNLKMGESFVIEFRKN